MLSQILDRTSERCPQQIAISFGDRTYTYAELKDLADQLARSLIELGIRKGDRIGVFLFNCPEMLLCYYACFKIGAVVVPILHCLKSAELKYIINHSQPKLLISQRAIFSEAISIEKELPSVEKYYLIDGRPKDLGPARSLAELLNENLQGTVLPEVDRNDVAIVIYTSGTTGKPKGVPLTHGQLTEHTVSHAKLVDYCSSDRTLLCLALCCNFGFSHQMLPAAYTGATLEIVPRFEPETVLDIVLNRGITMLYMMPVMYNEMIQIAASRGHSLSNQLRLCVVAGDATPLSVFNQFRHYFGLDLCEGLGMTETQIYTLNPLGKNKKLGSVGLPVSYMQVEVQDDRGQTLPTGTVGEVVVKGSIVTKGYLNNPEATTQSFRDNWFRTGDLGYFDEDGYLWFKGRIKQIIIRGGSNISPQEVEEAFYQHPDVLEAAAIGLPDPKWGEKVKAYVALKPESNPISEEAMLDYVRHRIADYKVPEYIEFVRSLPKGVTGKIDRRRLRERYYEQLEN
ncbi:MAG: class I adenylate-forming enzyme family protein [Synechococcus sp.]